MDVYFEIKSDAPKPRNADDARECFTGAMDRLVADLLPFHPKAVLVFGSVARWLSGLEDDRLPNDLDILLIGDNVPFDIQSKDYGCDIELHLFKTKQIIDIAKTLRYDSKAVALSKLYARAVRKSHSRDIIAAALLLGPEYNRFGIEQIEIDAREDTRDYSVHHLLHGHDWWRVLSTYARERRGPLRRFSDKLAHQCEFDQWRRLSPTDRRNP